MNTRATGFAVLVLLSLSYLQYLTRFQPVLNQPTANPCYGGLGPPFILKGDTTVAYGRATSLFSCRPERGGRGLPRGSASPRPWHRSSSACHLTLGERNSSPPPWLAYVSPSHWGTYGPHASPLARLLLRRPQHCTPLDFWAHGPVDASAHLHKWTGDFPGSGPGTSSRARLDFPGTTCRESSPGRLRVAREPHPGLACPPWHALPGTRVRPSPGTPCRGCFAQCLYPLERSKGLTPSFPE